jgi:hypothetical protein
MSNLYAQKDYCEEEAEASSESNLNRGKRGV